MGRAYSARSVLLAIPLIMSVALIITVVSGYFHVRTVRSTLVWGQADAILDQIRRDPPSRTADLTHAERILARFERQGVECVAFIHEAGIPSVVAGECAEAVRDAGLEEILHSEVLDLGERVRAVRSLGRPERPGAILVEFRPRLIHELEASADRTLWVGGAASFALVAVSLVFLKLAMRADRLHERLERDRRLSALGEMATVLSHEIRNPLASIKGHAQLLAESLEPDSKEKLKADWVVRETLRLERISADLLSFVGGRKIQRKPSDPVVVLREAVEMVGTAHFELDVDGSPVQWSLDAEMTHQALTNLLRNAVQASPPDRPAAASVGQEGDALVFTVRDFGDGIAPGTGTSIFEPFHTTRSRGTGLGLTVARRIASLHGGTLSADNHPGGGAVFRMSIPLELEARG